AGTIEIAGEQGKRARIAIELLRTVGADHGGIARQGGLAEVERGEQPGVEQPVTGAAQPVLTPELDGRTPKHDLAGAHVGAEPAMRTQPGGVGERGALAVHEDRHGSAGGPARAEPLNPPERCARLEIAQALPEDVLGQVRDAREVLEGLDSPGW